MILTLMIASVILILVAFVGIGFVLTFRALRSDGVRASELTIRERVRRYVGPVDPTKALLNRPSQVAVELFAALCGFPGLGWLISGRVFVGLVLMSVVPAFVWALYPVYLCASGKIAASPFLVVEYLPALSLISGTGLAIAQVVSKRQVDRHER